MRPYIGHEKVRGDPIIGALADKYQVTPAQIILAWHVARGTAAVPKSQDAERQKANITVSLTTLFIKSSNWKG